MCYYASIYILSLALFLQKIVFNKPATNLKYKTKKSKNEGTDNRAKPLRWKTEKGFYTAQFKKPSFKPISMLI